MLKKLNNHAQAVFGEYVLMIFIVVGMMGVMALFFRRALQARVYDARNAMAESVAERARGSYEGKIRYEYEPYYGSTESIVNRGRDVNKTLRAPGSEQVFQKSFNEYTRVETEGDVAPPEDNP